MDHNILTLKPMRGEEELNRDFMVSVVNAYVLMLKIFFLIIRGPEEDETEKDPKTGENETMVTKKAVDIENHNELSDLIPEGTKADSSDSDDS